MEEQQEICVRKKSIVKLLFVGVILLLAAHLGVHSIEAITGHDYLLGINPLFDFYGEANFPTWYSTVLLLTSSVLLVAVFRLRIHSGDKHYWLVLAGIFLFMSLDEFAQLHELIGSHISKAAAEDLLPEETGSSWIPGSAWVLWGGLASAIVALAYFRFWWRLESPVRLLFFVAAALYLGGALGFEVLEVYYVTGGGDYTGFLVMVTIEETMEMLGLVIFIWGLLDQLLLDRQSLAFRLN